MNLKSRKIISMALVFFMMLTILPMAPVTAHAEGSGDDCYIEIAGTKIDDLNVAASGDGWEYIPGEIPTVRLNNYHGKGICLYDETPEKGQDSTVLFEVIVDGNCTITGSNFGIGLFTDTKHYNNGGNEGVTSFLTISLKDNASLTINTNVGIANRAFCPFTSIEGYAPDTANCKVDINATAVGISAYGSNVLVEETNAYYAIHGGDVAVYYGVILDVEAEDPFVNEEDYAPATLKVRLGAMLSMTSTTDEDFIHVGTGWLYEIPDEYTAYINSKQSELLLYIPAEPEFKNQNPAGNDDETTGLTYTVGDTATFTFDSDTPNGFTAKKSAKLRGLFAGLDAEQTAANETDSALTLTHTFENAGLYQLTETLKLYFGSQLVGTKTHVFLIEVGEKPCTHNYEEISNTATCTTAGTKIEKCTLCGDSREGTAQPSEHIAITEEYAYDWSEHWQVCKNCNQAINVGNHTSGTDCTVCAFNNECEPVDEMEYQRDATHHWIPCVADHDCPNNKKLYKSEHIAYIRQPGDFSASVNPVHASCDVGEAIYSCQLGYWCDECQNYFGEPGKHKWELYSESDKYALYRCAGFTQEYDVHGNKISQCTATLEIEKAPHAHDWDIEHPEVVTPATCTTDGVSKIKCACGASQNITTYATGHDWGKWPSYITPRCNEDPITIIRTCENDESHTDSKTINGIHMATDWTTDKDSHWKVCGYCNTKIVVPKEAHEDINSDNKCDVCEYDMTPEVIPPCTHPNKDWDKDAAGHWYVCPDCEDLAKDVKDHEYDGDADADCNVCGYEREITVPEPECTHENKELDKDADGHWYVCPDCEDLVKDVKDHEYDGDADADCNVCGYEREITVPEPECTHANKKLDKDAAGHWYVCPDCEELAKDVENHVYDNSKDATCNVCEYTRTISSGSSSGGGFSGSYNYPVIVGDTDGADVAVSDDYAVKGEKITITVKPDAGEQVDEVIVTDKDGKVIPVTKTGDNEYTFTMPASKVTVDVATEAADYGLRIVMQINNRNILVNGKTMVNDVAPVIVGDRTLVPIRVVTELLGGSADWDNATRTVTLKIDGKTMNMTIGKEIPGFGTSAVIMNDRTYVPVRYVMEKLGAEVEWINATRQIIIEK